MQQMFMMSGKSIFSDDSTTPVLMKSWPETSIQSYNTSCIHEPSTQLKIEAVMENSLEDDKTSHAGGGEIICLRKIDWEDTLKGVASVEDLGEKEAGQASKKGALWKVINWTLPASSDVDELSTFSNESVWTFDEQIDEKLEVELWFMENVDLHECDDEEPFDHGADMKLATEEAWFESP